MALALVGGLLVGLLVLRDGSAPELTRSELDDARERWRTHGPASYTLAIQMAGRLTDHRTITVENGTVVEMTVDGEPASETSWEYWSVEGLFSFLEDELDNKADPPPSLGVSGPDQIVLRARFDPDLGYPSRFLRHLLGRQMGTEWEVVEFEARP